MEKYPLIKHVKYTMEDLKRLKLDLKDDEERQKIIFRFPTVYIILDKGKNKKYHAYVGETNDIDRRTYQHINYDPIEGGRDDFKEFNENDSDMLIIGHDHFNKSLTLDIENRMMLYLLSSEMIGRLNNRRTNSQDHYYTKREFIDIFSMIWKQLNKYQPDAFPDEEEIKKSAIYKSSPFHTLMPEQVDAIMKIEAKIDEDIKKYDGSDMGTLILVEGAAGTGKTVLLSQIFKDLNMDQEDKAKAFIAVNHKEQQVVYKDIATKLGFVDFLDRDIVAKSPSNFINTHSVEDKVDVLLVDEAHLLFTQGNQGYSGDNQLKDLLRRAKIVVTIFDPHQIINRVEYLSKDEIKKMEDNARKEDNLIRLSSQIRMNANEETLDWINSLIFNKQVKDIPEDNQYDLKISNDVNLINRIIKQKNGSENSKKDNGSRMIATYDWDYSQGKSNNGDPWTVRTGSLELPWNFQLKKIKGFSKLPWVEQPQTINEIGSTFSIQGFDLNYSGLIIGKSVQFRNGKIEYHSENSKDDKVIKKRKVNGKAVDVSEELIQNELNVLMKRGVKGMYIYAVDDELRAELIRRAGSSHILKM